MLRVKRMALASGYYPFCCVGAWSPACVGCLDPLCPMAWLPGDPLFLHFPGMWSQGVEGTEWETIPKPQKVHCAQMLLKMSAAPSSLSQRRSSKHSNALFRVLWTLPKSSYFPSRGPLRTRKQALSQGCRLPTSGAVVRALLGPCSRHRPC